MPTTRLRCILILGLVLQLAFQSNAQTGSLRLAGTVIDAETTQPVPYVNIGLRDKNLGTLSDEDGSFELFIPAGLGNDSIHFSSIGYAPLKVRADQLSNSESNKIILHPSRTMLKEVIVTSKKYKRERLGWMGGKDGVLPLDTLQGGGAIALLVESPASVSYVDKLQVRLMYNSKDTLQFRLHFYGYDQSTDAPGKELLSKEIMLKQDKRFGWLRFDLEKEDIRLYEKKFFVGFEWIDDRKTRKEMHEGLRAWERWKQQEYHQGNKKVEKLSTPGKQEQYKYHGNMMDWPGFKSLPPFTGLMIETGKTDKTKNLRTFERKASFGKWREIPSTLNAVVTVSY